MKLLCLFLYISLIPVYASSGRTDQNGCHTDTVTGQGYHCHGYNHANSNYNEGHKRIVFPMQIGLSLGYDYKNFEIKISNSKLGLSINSIYKLYIFSNMYLAPQLSWAVSNYSYNNFTSSSGVYIGAVAGIDFNFISKNKISITYDIKVSKDGYGIQQGLLNYIFTYND